MTEGTSTLASMVPELAQRHGEPDWLKNLREAAWQAYEGMPVPRLEKSDLTKRPWDIANITHAADAAPSAEARGLIEQLEQAGSTYLWIRNGQFVAGKISEELTKQGVVLADLHAAAKTHEALVKKHLSSVVNKDESKWAALNAALWQGGAFVYVPKNVQASETLHVVYEDTGAGSGSLPRSLVVAEDGSSVAFAQVLVAAGESAAGSVNSYVLEVVAEPTARVTVVSNNQFRKGPTHCTTMRAVVGNDASVDWVFTDVGDGYTVGLVESNLQGSGSRSTVRALGLGYGRQHLDLTASILHSGRYSTSDIVMHGVLRERANSIYRSSTHIFKNAVGAGSEQHDRMLVMNGTARADAIPMLLIDENDVQRCGHAASVGRIDENQIYYLMARGIPKLEATKMIIWGYLHPTVEAIPSEALREYVTSLIDRELA